MRLLLDAHAVVWFLIDRKRIPTGLMSTLVDPAKVVYVSAVAVWEARIKVGMNKLSLPLDELESTIVEAGSASCRSLLHMLSSFDICRPSTVASSTGLWWRRPDTRA